MERGAYSSKHVDAMSDEVMERMRRADPLVRRWLDPGLRAQVDPEVPEVVGPPTRLKRRQR